MAGPAIPASEIVAVNSGVFLSEPSVAVDPSDTTRSLTGGIFAFAALAAMFSQPIPLAGNVAGAATFVGAVTSSKLLAGGVAGNGNVNAALTFTRLFAGAISGAGAVTGTINVSGTAALVGAISGLGATAGSLTVVPNVALAGTILGLGATAGALTVSAGVPVPSNAYAAFAGDSRTDNGFDKNTGRFYHETRGMQTWALPISGHRFRIASPNQYGVSGDTSAMLLARWSAVLADTAGTIVLLIGTNDRGTANMTLQQSIDNVSSMLTQANTAGKIVILGNEMPRSGANALTGQQLTNHTDFHNWLTAAPATFPNVISWDSWGAITNTTTDFVDGLHPGTEGAKKAGATLAAAINTIFPNVDYSFPSNTALNANPTMTGTGGTKGTGTTGAPGQLADNYTSAISGTGTNVSAVFSKGPSGEQVITLSGTAAASAQTLTIRPTTDIALAAAASFDVRSRIVLEAGSTGIGNVTPEARIDGTSQQQSRAIDLYQAPDQAPTGGFDYILNAPPRTVPTSGVTTQRGQIVVGFVPSAAVSAVIRIFDHRVRAA